MASRSYLRKIVEQVIVIAKAVAVSSALFLVGALPASSQAHPSKADLNMALLKAAGHNRSAEVKALLAQGADANTKVSDANSIANGYTPIMLLAMHKDVDAATIQALQKAGGDINAVDPATGNTALMNACTIGSVSEVRVLLARGAKVDIADANGDTALMTAASCGCDDIVRILLDHGAKVNTQSSLGQTALFITANGPHGPSARAQQFYTKRVRVLHVLLSKGANVNLKAKNGATPLMMAAYHGNVEMVKAFLKQHADVTARDAKGRTALQMAIKRNQSQEVIQLLKAAGTKE